jgi:hypothetical protein
MSIELTDRDLLNIHRQAHERGWDYTTTLAVFLPDWISRKTGKGKIHVKFQPLKGLMAGTTYWDPYRARYQVVLRENMGSKQTLATLAHELVHISSGHVSRDYKLQVPWLDNSQPNTPVNEQKLERILERRQADVDTEKYMQALEAKTEEDAQVMLFLLWSQLGVL